MNKNNNNAIELCVDEYCNNDPDVIDVFSNKNMYDQLIEKYMGLPEDIRKNVQLTISAQGPGIKFPNNGLGNFEVKPSLIQMMISTIHSN